MMIVYSVVHKVNVFEFQKTKFERLNRAFTHPRYMVMGFAVERILKISFANIGEVTDWIELNFGMCIANIHTNISTTGFVKILFHC